jgi:hypothetical protein
MAGEISVSATILRTSADRHTDPQSYSSELARTTAGLTLDDAARAIDLKEAYGKSGADRLARLKRDRKNVLEV